jgi:hypothetical protein
MLAFNSSDFYFHPEDKGMGFSNTAFEDSANDLFDQYVSHDSPDPRDSVNKANGFQAYEFSFDDDNRSRKCKIGDKAFNIPAVGRSHRYTPKGLRGTQSQEVLPSQAYQKFTRLERPKAVISGVELLNLEGKLVSQTGPVKSSFSSSSTPAPPLRRKARFSANPPETLRYRSHKVSKGPGTSVGEPSKMMRPSYYYRSEMPSFHEWTQRFQQISLQAPSGNLPMAHSSCDDLPRDDKQPRNVPKAKSSHPISEQQEVFDQKFRPSQGSTILEASEYDTLSSALISEIEKHAQQSLAMTSSGKQETSNQNMQSEAGPSVRSRSSPSWLQEATSTESFDFPLSPGQTQWLNPFPDSSTCYFDNFEASQSAPALAHASSKDFLTHGRINSFGLFDQFVNEDPSNEYFVTPSDVMYPSEVDVYPPLPSPTLPPSSYRPQTPSSCSSSVCLSPTVAITSKSPSKPRRQSKSMRRKCSAGGLKSPTSLDFVNFTPSDSQKILLGVAPSGSSKTKARREQEAIEKAAREAGGDVEQLRTAGVFAVLGE